MHRVAALLVCALSFTIAPAALARRGEMSTRGAAIKVSRLPGVDRAIALGRGQQDNIIVLGQSKLAVHTYFVNAKTRKIDFVTPGDLADGARSVVQKKVDLASQQTGKPFPYRIQVGDATSGKLPLLSRQGRIRIGLVSPDGSRPNRNVLYDLFAPGGKAVTSDPADRIKAPPDGPLSFLIPRR